MSEINGPKISVNQIGFNGVQKNINESAEESNIQQEPKFKDFSDPKAEALGRAMLVKTDKITQIQDTDNTDNDLKVLLDNPQVAENSDEMFEAAYTAAKDSGVANPYEEAATFSTGNV